MDVSRALEELKPPVCPKFRLKSPNFIYTSSNIVCNFGNKSYLRAQRGQPHAHDIGERRRVLQARDRDVMDLVVCGTDGFHSQRCR